MEPIDKIILNRQEKKKARSERSELIKFFHENIENKTGKKYPVAFIAMKMSGYSVKDLYYLQSQAKDYANRGGSIGKYFWSLFKV